MFFGKSVEINFKPTLGGVPVDWVSEWKYLGVTLKSGRRFGCSVTDKVKSFYRSLNSILRVEGRSDDMVLLRLVEAHCVPILSYAAEIIHVSDRDERRSLRVAYNSIFRRIFGYRYFESVSNLQHSLGRLTWEELVGSRHLIILDSCTELELAILTLSFGHFANVYAFFSFPFYSADCHCNYGKKKNRTVTSFAHKSFKNSPSVLRFLLELLFSILKHH